MSANMEEKTRWLDRPVLPILKLDLEKTLYWVFILAAIASRFWLLGERSMSHDESLHTYYSWSLFQGGGYTHTPLTHGPFLFHINALIYSFFGADDFTSRISVALFGVALVALPFVLRRWLGRTGALITSFMILISPSLWYHARYIRDEAFMLVWIMLLAWGLFGYLHDRATKWLYLVAIAAAFAFISMEATFIFVAIFGFFLISAVLIELADQPDFWRGIVLKLALGVAGAVGILFVAVIVQTILLQAIGLAPGDPSPFPVPVQPLQPGQPIEFSAQLQYILQLLWGILRVGLSMLIPAGLIGYGIYRWLKTMWPAAVRESRSFDLVVVLGSLSLFMLSAALLPILNSIWKILYQLPFVDVNFFEGGNFPTTDVGLVLRLGAVTFGFIAAAGAIGWWWSPRKWLPLTGAFVGIGATFFTTVFTNGVGLGTGFVGSLGYWLVQQGVQRGTQPIYYYLIITPFYEYLPMLVAAIATVVYTVRAIRARRAHQTDGRSWPDRLFVPFVFVWMIGAWAGFSYAGEKMPWLMVYLALPMIVLSGRFLGEWLDTIDWRAVIAERQWLAGLLLAVAIVSGAWAIGNLQKSFSGLQLDSLVAFSGWFSALIVLAIAVLALWRMSPRPSWRAMLRLTGLIGLIALAALTLRTGWIWNYLNYDSALEYGVYAHGGPGVKEVVKQIAELSQRTTGGKLIKIAFDADASWPFYWYLRDYPNKTQMSNSPSRTDLDVPVIISSAATWNSVDNATRKTHTYWQGHRIWWPMEDYKKFADCPLSEFDTTTGAPINVAAYDENSDGKIDDAEKARGKARCDAYFVRHIPNSIVTVGRWLFDPERRTALVDIFLNRDYAHYAALRGLTVNPQNGAKPLTPNNWPLVDDFRLYVRKDIGTSIWTESAGGVQPITPEQADPYLKGWRDVAAVQVWGATGTEAGQFQSAHSVAVAADGSIYVADGFNHRVQKFTAKGEYVMSIGTPSGPVTNPPEGAFNEPWGVAAAADGSIYVADTWNHRIQHFKADGTFINSWGALGDTGGQATGNEGLFYGPRSVVVDANGRVLVGDTGNKRIQVFDKDGKFITQFGGGGLDQGRLDEPVGVAVDPQGNIVVADTWNGRVQVFDANGQSIAAWDIDGWLDKATVGKPYIAVDAQSRVYVADEVSQRILVFDETGKYLGGFGQYGTDDHGFTMPGGIAIDREGFIYVVDTGAGRIMKFPPF
jgi:predicted membrane-bound mannosyltransferase/DNA-binding beta-propeller fold protein YncE